MTHEVRQTRRFARQYKKLHDNVAADVNNAVEAIAENPALGERKKGDLAHHGCINSAAKATVFIGFHLG